MATIHLCRNRGVRFRSCVGPRFIICLVTIVAATAQSARAADRLTPPEIWRDYDPSRGDFKEEIVASETRGGILLRRSYISAYVLGQEIRVFCLYSVKAGLTHAPGLLDVHGWMGEAAVHRDYVENGWAVMGFDYCGKTGSRKDYTRYPQSVRQGNMDEKEGPAVHDSTPDLQSITDPRQTSEYLWYAIERRTLSYLEQQKEVDKNRLGATGYSYGGTILWALGTDPRVKAIVPHFGIGWIEYYRNKQVWMYNNPYVEPAKTPGEEIFLTGMSPEAYVPYMTAATLYLTGSNDHHGGFERGLESFKRFGKGVPWTFAVQARGHHNTEKIEQDCRLWLEKYVAGKDVFLPDRPRSKIQLDANGIPELIVAPAQKERVAKVEMYYALKSACSFNRSWRDTASNRHGEEWVGTMPVMTVDDYVFGYANITYDNGFVVSTEFNAVIPSKLGAARATDTRSDSISLNEETAGWTNVSEVEGPGGIKGFRSSSNQAGTETEKLNDPKWNAPPGGQLSFKLFCTEPQTLLLSVTDYYEREIAVTASDNWQEFTIPASTLLNRFDKRPMKDWSGVGSLHLLPKQGSDITKVLFAQFKWARDEKAK
jgi:dienelactone hydrolase